MRLENWEFIGITSDPYKAPEQAKVCAYGNIYGDSRFPDGHRIHTSTVVAKRGNMIRTKSGSIYELGKPTTRFVAWLESRGQSINDYQDFGEM